LLVFNYRRVEATLGICAARIVTLKAFSQGAFRIANAFSVLLSGLIIPRVEATLG
jgi:hypothetical protein